MAYGIQLVQSEHALSYEFNLTRHTGKKITLKKGNEIINSNDRMHYMVKRALTEHLRTISYDTVKNTHPTFSPDNPYFNEDHPCNVLITIYGPTRRRTDAPNFYPTIKALIDGMTDAGVWADDNNKIIHTFGFVSGGLSGTKQYRIIINITPDESELTLNDH